MAVFKATKNRKKVDEKDDKNVFKATSNKNVDMSIVKGWENSINDDSEKLNEYITRRSEGGYIPADEVDEYRKTAKRYKTNRSRYNSFLKSYSDSYDEAAEGEHSNWITSVLSDMDSSYDYFSQFNSEIEYKDAKKVSELYNMSTKELSPYIDEMNKADAEKKTQISSLREEKKKINNKIIFYNRGDRSYYKTYDAVKKDKEKIKEINDQIDKLNSDTSSGIAYTTMGGQNITWQSLYDRKKDEEEFNALYSSISGSDDFEAAVKAGSEYQNPDTKTAEKGKSIVNKVKYVEENLGMLAIGEANGGGSNIVHSRINLMTDGEKEIYNYYFGRGEYDKAEEYLASIDEKLIDRFEEEEVESFKAMADDLPVFSSALSVPLTLFSGAEYIKDTANYFKTGELDDNHLANVGTTIRGTVSEKVDWEIGNWDAFDFLYNTGMSMADSVTSATMLGWGGGVALGLSAASQGTNDALNRGMSKDQAFWSGISAGTFEMLFETVSIGQFKALKEIPAATIKDIAKNIGKSMLVNATEETLTEIANVTYDKLVNADFSNADTKIRAYIAAGMSEEEAKDKVMWETVGQIAESGASGLLMGIGMGGTASAISYAENSSNAKDMYGDSQKEIVAKGLASEEGSLSNKLAQKYQNKLNKGKNLTGGQLYNQVMANDMKSITDAATSRLSELGESGDVNAIATALAKQAAGEALTSTEKQAIESSKYGQRVANELNPENIKSEQYTSQWAEKIDTQRINAAEYSRLVNEAETAQKGAETVEGATITPVQEAAQEAPTEAAEAPVTQVEPEKVEEIQQPDVVSEEIAPAEKAEQGSTVTLEDASKKYGAQAQDMVHTYQEGQDVEEFDSAYELAYNMGKSGVNISYAMNSEGTFYLTEDQRKLAYEAGKAAADTLALEKDAANKKAVNGKKGRKKGVVKGEGVTISDLKKSFNDTQNTAYKLLSTYAEATGIDIVLYRSEADAEGKLRYEKFKDSQGAYDPDNPGTIYIDVNAGLAKIKDVSDLARYTMIRTFAHEFTHFIENWNPIQYNEFRKVVFDTLTERGEDVELLIKELLNKNPEMSYDKASREIVAEAMTDILPDANFVEKLANEHKTIFEKLIEKLKEFVSTLREYYNSLGHNRSREANALKEQVGDAVHYMESIVNLFDKVAAEAVENYQATVATDEVTTEVKNEVKTEVKTEAETTTSDHGFTITDNLERGSLEITFDGKPSEAVRDVLKENKFRWHREKKLWYGYAERGAITDALNKAYESETVSEMETVGETVDTPTEIVGETEKKPSDFETAFWNATQEERDEVVEAINENTKISHVAPTEIREQVVPEEAITPTEKTEEAINNGTENVDNGETVLEPDTDGQGTSRLLDESQVEDVQRDESERDLVDDAGQRESETSRDGDRADTDAGDSRSEGSSESGDLRRNDELTDSSESVTDTNVGDKLHEEVEKQIEQKSTEKPKGNNFVIDDSLNLPRGEKARFRANVDAIRLIKQLATEGRNATAAEQEILSKYVGWGGLSNAFGDLVYNREARRSEMTPKEEWKKEFEELKGLVDEGIITEQEYKDMSASTRNAHYTSVEVIKAMYDGLAQLGFKGGRMLEPSSGVGNFVGAMPADMSAKVNSWTMVELDRITGQIAKNLYPNADVRIQGFETANIPDNYMDVAIGNVPFGDYGVFDRTYPKRITKSIHNYFFAKSIDKVRPGGIVMFITSSFTMDSKDAGIRQYMMDRADLLGAIRLPETAFKDNARTDVVTDILILQKREGGTEYAGVDFLTADYDYKYGSYVSNYFKEHPEMVLGTPVTKRGMYGANTLSYEPLKDRGTIGDQIREAFKNVKGEMTYSAKLSPEKTNFAVERATKKTKSGGFVVNGDGSISRSENGQLVKVDADEKTAKRITGMLGIRDAYRNLANYLQQGQDAKTVKQARKALNTAYDAFVKEHGYLNSPANRKAIDTDPDSYSILSLENYDAKKKTAKKADIFTKDTISANKTVTHVDSVGEGVIASLNLTGGVDTALIAKLTSRSVEDVTKEIISSRLAFKTKDGSLVARESYLAGNVRAKLREAESLAPFDRDYEHNVEELKRVIPKDIPYNEIYVTPGNAFIPNEVYADFIAHMLGGRNNPNSYSGPDVEVGRTASGEFKINLNNKRLKTNYNNTQTWGTARKSFLDLIDAMMGSRTVKVNDTVETADGKKISVLNEAETEAANEKVKAIQKEFEDWLWKDEGRRTELAKLYNETFNAIVNPKYDGSNLTVNGINADFKLREHQANAVHRIISSGGNTLLAHRVGAGKTLEMAAAAMKLRELGVVKKPMFAVPKSLVAQWGVEFHSYFPASRILVADDKSFTPANRKIFTNKIANGDYDAVIVSYEQFEKIPMSAEYQTKFYEEQIDEIINAIAEEKAESRDGKGLTVKEMEKKKASLEKKLKELTSKPKDENNIDFEMLGIDSLFVDEAHNFKNLEYVSKMTNVAGLGSAKGSQRAFDLYTKTRYLQSLNGGRGIVFATATPVMNSMVELYIMQRYLQPDTLQQLGLKSFDAWAKQFGEVVNKWEINPSGTGMRQKQVFANFKNLNELQLLFRSFSDVLTEVPGLKIPKMKGGAVKIVECEPGQFQKDYMLQLQKRAEVVKTVDPSIDNMLKITSDGRKVSYTQRMIDPSLPYEEGCKLYSCCENVLTEYKDSSDNKGTQIIFCDMATPKGSDKSKADNSVDNVDDTLEEEGSAKLYDDMRAYLVKKGIPAKEIAFIHEADSDAKRKQLFADVNDGKVRVLIGSTGKMGVGMNAQKRIVAIHHLDAPWRPGDVEQRDGRAFRQKNMNEEVSKYVYVTKGSFDSRLWDILDRKQHFIGQIMNGEDVGRSAEDTGEVTLSAAEVKALASGNPLIEEQTKLTDAIKKLENLQKAYNSSIRLAKTKLSDDEQNMAYYKGRIANIKEDIKSRVDTYSEGKFSMNVGGQVFTDKKDAGMALATEIAAKAVQSTYVTVGTFGGFELKVMKDAAEYRGLIQGKATYKFNVYLGNTTRMVNHIGEIVAGFENQITNAEQMLSDVSADHKAQQDIIAKPFEKADELAEKRARFNEVMELLAPKNEQQLGNDSDDVQYQSRDYLSDDSDMRKSRDAEGHKLSKQQREYFKYSVIRDKWGRLIPVYHGTKQAGFHVFSKSDDIGYFFAKSIKTAETYSDSKTVYAPDKNSPEISGAANYKVYLNITNPLIIEGKGAYWNNLEAADDLVDLDIAVKSIGKDGACDVTVKTGIKGKTKKYTFKNTNDIYSFFNNTFNSEFAEGMAKYMDISTAETGKMDISVQFPWNFEQRKESYNTKKTRDIVKVAYNSAEKYDGVIFKNIVDAGIRDKIKPDDVYVALESEQIKSVNNTEPTNARDIRYQQRTEALTDREILSMAANELSTASTLTEGEKTALEIFRTRLGNLEDLQMERAKEGRLYKEQQFGEHVDRKAAEETRNRMQILDGKIKDAEAEVLSVENKEVLKKVLHKARKVVEKQDREHFEDRLRRYRDRRKNAADIKKYRDRLRGDVDELSNWILHPDAKSVAKRVPDALKNTVIPFLSSINFMSKRSLNGGAATQADEAFMAHIEKLNSALKTNIELNGLYSGYNDLPADFMDRLQNFIKSTDALVKKKSGELVINQMTSEELKDLSQIVRTLKKYIMQINSFHYNAMYEHVYEAGENSIEHLQDLGNAGNTGAVSNFLLWQQMRPAYAFERFGDGGIAIYDGLRRGQAQLAFNTKEIVEFTEKLFKENGIDVKALENDIREFELGGDKVKIPVSHLMGLYEMYKDVDKDGNGGKKHINEGGIRVATYTHKGEKISDNGHILTVGETNKLLSVVEKDERLKKVADSLQQFMATKGAEWGNHVTVARFGEEQFTNPTYYPINSDGRHLQAMAKEEPSSAALYALLNMSFTKQRKEGANNRVILYSIFDVFSNHMASMAQYNAMALPVLDALKWFNYKQVSFDDDGNKHIGDSVRERMDRAYGVPDETKPGSGKSGYAQNFVMNIIKAFNGTEAQGTPYDSIGLKALHTYNVAQVAYNFRVVVQQPMAITRAGLLIDYKSILKGMKLNPKAIQKNIEEMQKYSGIAAWKSLGFYDVNISRGLTSLIKHDDTFMDKVIDVGMWGAEKADLLTWAAMWSACKEEVIKKQKLVPQDEGFYDTVTKLFEDVIYKTQVVDSVLTKNEFMRDKGAFARTMGSFMSEPTTTASMLIDAFDKYALDKQRGMTNKQAWDKNKKMIGRTMYVYAVGSVLLAVVQAAVDAFRDDDEYEERHEKWLEAFVGNFIDEILPFNKLPIISDFYDLAKEILSIFGVDTYGNPPQSVIMQWYDSLIKGTEIIYDNIAGKDTNYTYYAGIFKLLQAASGMTGVPMAAVTRSVVNAWNASIGAMAPSLKVKSYDPGDEAEIKYAYLDGYLSDGEAAELLVEQRVVETGDDARFTVEGWKLGVSAAAAEGYITYCEPAGISLKEFNKAWKYNSDTKADEDENGDPISGSKKAKVLDYIDGLNLSDKQKDSLYYAFGWAESKINEAPWH